jgi:CheY-like chemotaxis protein
MNAQNIISVVLADDDEDDCLFFKDAIRDLPMATRLSVVRDGKKLMELLNEKKHELPDVVFMDLTMPVKDGFECMSEIRNKEALHHLPVVILSTHSSPDIIAQILLAGADDYVRKPEEFSELKALILKSIMSILNHQSDLSKK